MNRQSPEANPAGMLHFVVPGDLSQLTGGYIYDRRIVAELRDLGVEVRVHELAGRFPVADTEAHRSAVRFLRTLADRPTVVIDGLALPAFAAVAVELATKVRLVALVHHPLSLETGLAPADREDLARAEAFALRRAGGVIVTSPGTRMDVAGMGVPHERIGVVEPGVDAPSVEKLGHESRAGAQPRLLCVATVTERKGHLTLVEALAAIRGLRWRLDCAGSLDRDPTTTARLREAINRLRLGERIRLHGEVSSAALERLYAAADVFVLASHHEGYGMALAEAMRYGVPVVATRVGAIPQTVPAKAGMLVPPGDAGALAVTLRRVLQDDVLRHRMAAAARRVRRSPWPESGRRFLEEIRTIEARNP